MAIIQCPGCRERVSNVQKLCPHCGYGIKGGEQGLSLAESRKRISRKRKAGLEMQSYAALLAFVIGILWIWFGFSGNLDQASYASIFVTCGAALWYLVVRILMIFPKILGRQ